MWLKLGKGIGVKFGLEKFLNNVVMLFLVLYMFGFVKG